MKHFNAILAAIILCSAPAQSQTLKSLMVNTSNGVVAYSQAVEFQDDVSALAFDASFGSNSIRFDSQGVLFSGVAAAATRTNLGLGATNDVVFNRLVAGATNQLSNTSGNIVAQNGSGEEFHINAGGFTFYQSTNAVSYLLAEERLLGGGNWGVEASLTIRQSSATNGLLFVYRTNNEPFLGLANLIASNNVTVSNETLFRVGVAEATNRSAQFGFRSTNTNGNGVAVFSVFGYNALMMIGPSDPNAGTNPIQATVYSIAPTNKVMTLITTNTGAMQMHRPIGIDTAGVSTNAPANTTNVAGWIQFYVGTNSVRVPYYQ